MAATADHLNALGRSDGLPAAALLALVADIEAAAPVLRDLLDKAARGRPLSDEEASLFFYGLHVLAAVRDRESLPALLRLLRRPLADVEDLLGDSVTASLRKVLAGLYDEDVEALLAAAVDPRIDEAARDALLSAAVFLTWDGRIARDRMHAFLARFETETPPPDGDLAWLGWLLGVSQLGMRDLMPAVERVFAARRLPENVLELRDVEQDLRDAERAPDDIERFTTAGLGYADDVLDTLRWLDWHDDAPPEEPIVNPHRHVGRNDPCPCGSGKKFKKCCLASA